MGVKDFLKKVIFGKKASSQSYITFLKKIGVQIGENVDIIDVRNFTLDITRPFLLEFGSDITFSDHVTIMTHDYSWSVVAKKNPGKIYPSLGKVRIGNNVFIGTHATILQNVAIGNNVIIGAGSVVTRDIPDNSVAVGVPAKVIMSLDEMEEKLAGRAENNLALLVNEFWNCYHKEPDEYALREHLAYYCGRDDIREKNSEYYRTYRLENAKCDVQKYRSKAELLKDLIDKE